MKRIGDPDDDRPRSTRYRERNLETCQQRDLETYHRDREANRAKCRDRYRRAKLRCLQAYSAGDNACCACCGESEIAFLTLDHINGGGRAHNRLLNTSGTSFYHRLVTLGFPHDPPLQVLCYNCNCGRRINGGICPHQQKGQST